MGASVMNYVEVPLPAELVEALEVLGQENGVSAEEMLERALCDERQWVAAAQAIKANIAAPPGRLAVRCPCCEPHFCQHVLIWRGKRRCACTPERLKDEAA